MCPTSWHSITCRTISSEPLSSKMSPEEVLGLCCLIEDQKYVVSSEEIMRTEKPFERETVNARPKEQTGKRTTEKFSSGADRKTDRQTNR